MGLGDDIMMGGEYKAMYEKTNKKIIPDGQWSPMWNNIDYIVKEGDNTLRLPTHPNGNRPYIERWGNNQIIFKEYQPKIGELVFNDKENQDVMKILRTKGLEKNSIYFNRLWGRNEYDTPVIYVNPDSKNTTSCNNKEWPWEYWCELVESLSNCDVIRCKPQSTHDVSGNVPYNNPDLPGAINIDISDPRLAFNIMSGCDLVITTEGGAHHAAAALGIEAIVLYGAFISPKNTGYSHQHNIYNGPDIPYGSTIPDDRCIQAMRDIKTHRVLELARNLLSS